MSTVPPSWCFGDGVVCVLGTHDADGEPNVTRAACGRLAEDGRTLFVYVSVPEGLEALDNISANGHIAVTFTAVANYRSLQVKGTDARLVSNPDDAAYVRARNTSNFEGFTRVGYPATYIQRLWSPETVTVAFTPEAAWNQSPGPDAGREVSR